MGRGCSNKVIWRRLFFCLYIADFDKQWYKILYSSCKKKLIGNVTNLWYASLDLDRYKNAILSLLIVGKEWK